jgi:hypothetical protein
LATACRVSSRSRCCRSRFSYSDSGIISLPQIGIEILPSARRLDKVWLLPWTVRPLDFVIDNFSRFSEGLGGGWYRDRRGQPQSIFIIYGDDETGLAREIESVEMVSLGLEDHSLRSNAALKSAIACSRVAT